MEHSGKVKTGVIREWVWKWLGKCCPFNRRRSEGDVQNWMEKSEGCHHLEECRIKEKEKRRKKE